MRCEVAALLAVAGLAAWAPAASAVSVTQESPVEGATQPIVEVADDEAVANDITIEVRGDRLVVTDTTAIQVRPMVGCEGRLGADTVTCPVPALVRVNALGGDDRVTVTGVDAVLYGGDGNDTLSGGRVIDGGPGDDVLTGTDADDALTGGAGADTVTAAAATTASTRATSWRPTASTAGPASTCSTTRAARPRWSLISPPPRRRAARPARATPWRASSALSAARGTTRSGSASRRSARARSPSPPSRP